MRDKCTHLDQVRVTELPESVDGCEECLKTGDPWLHLRICLECGRVGCCDSSPNRHASRHARETGHALIQSLEPGEVWRSASSTTSRWSSLKSTVRRESHPPPLADGCCRP
jgi:hypothetical protein